MRSIRVCRHCASFLVVVASLVVAPLTASAHPSDFRTLTIDLLFGADGLEAIEAAVVESSGPSYEPSPSVELRQAVAEEVVAALGIPNSAASIDAEMSERYHQVGFLITFEEPLPGQAKAFQFDTGQLQAIAQNTNLQWLKLGVCAEISETFDALDINASSDGRPPANNTSERPWCRIWRLETTDRPVTVNVQAVALPMTGLPVIPVGIAGLGLLASGILVVRSQRTTGAS